MAPPLAGKFLLTLPQSDLSSSSSQSKSKPSSSSSSSSSLFSSSNSSKVQNNKHRQHQQRPNLVLFQVPSCLDDILAGNCQILASNESASLVTPTSSVQLVTVGTSNSLVVWKQQQQQQRQSKGKATVAREEQGENAVNNEDTTSRNISSSTASASKDLTSSNKRSKTVTSCRLIKPGGSGASFLVGQSNPIQRDELLHFFTTNSNNDKDSSSSARRFYSTETLSNLFQCSNKEMEEMLSQIPTIVPFLSVPPRQEEEEEGHAAANTTSRSTSTSTSTSTSCYWQLVPEEEVLYGQKALVQMLVESDADDDGGNDDYEKNRNNQEKSLIEKLDVLTKKVSERLLPILMEHESETQAQRQDEAVDSTTDGTLSSKPSSPSSSSWSLSREERSKAISRKTILLAETKTQKGKIRHPNHCRLGGGDGATATSSTSPLPPLLRSNIRIDPNIIAFYVLRDLFMEQPSYHLSDLLTKWSTRLPFGEKYDRIIPDDSSANSGKVGTTINTVTTEWLKDRKIIPDQLTISIRKNNVKDNDPVQTSTTTSKKDATAVSIIELTKPGTVLTL